jgi:hypothetical protein
MNPHKQSITSAALAPAPRWSRRRLIVVIVVGVLVVSASAYLALRYFILCGNCGGGPILCPDPCTLPTFGHLDPGLNAASAPSPPPHRVS